MPWVPALQKGDLTVCAGWNRPALCFQSENAFLKPDIFQESCNCRDFSSKAVKSRHSLCSRSSVGQWPESQLLGYNVKRLNAITVLMIKSSSVTPTVHSWVLAWMYRLLAARSALLELWTGSVSVLQWGKTARGLPWMWHSLPLVLLLPGTALRGHNAWASAGPVCCFVQHFKSLQQLHSCSA